MSAFEQDELSVERRIGGAQAAQGRGDGEDLGDRQGVRAGGADRIAARVAAADDRAPGGVARECALDDAAERALSVAGSTGAARAPAWAE